VYPQQRLSLSQLIFSFKRILESTDVEVKRSLFVDMRAPAAKRIVCNFRGTLSECAAAAAATERMHCILEKRYIT
jgi:hypothetical protein